MTLTRDVYNQAAKKVSQVTLPEDIFNVSWNPDLVHDVFQAMEANARTPVAHTKFRGEVSGTGKKPWKQKGTGRARHGSRRSPIWVGGGVAHGPRNARDYSKKVNKKAKSTALKSLLSRKLKEDQVLFIEGLDFSAPKSKDTRVLLDNLAKIKGFDRLSSRRGNVALFVLPEHMENFEKSIRNFGVLDAVDAVNLDVRDVLSYRFVIIVSPDASIENLKNRLNPKKESVVAV